MRAFIDEWGRTWDVVAGRESWGAFFAIFVPRSGAEGSADDEPGVRQAPLAAAGHDAAQVELDSLTDEELRGLLARSSPKNNG